MFTTRPRSTTRLTLIGAGTAGAVALAGLLYVAPQATAAPTPDCATAYPVAELTRGMPVNGLTVSDGTTPETFTGEVLGVLDDGIAPGLDMVIADLESPAIDAAGGIWQGMSGSPVYADDGRLIGAVAYGLAWGGSPVAGITPFEDMQGYLGAPMPAPRVKIGARMAERIAAETDVTTQQAGRGLRHLPMPTGVTGLKPERAFRLGDRTYVDEDSYRVGRGTGSSAADVDTVVAGGNIAAVESMGDITSAGVGTVTSVCGDRVVAFGHPMAFRGETTFGLAAADAIYVQPDPLGVPFKVANIGDLGGTITDDRLAGIAGTFGDVPASTPFESVLRYRDRSRTGTTDVLVPDALAAIAFYGNLANHDRVIDGIIGGSETQTWRIAGTRADGSGFVLHHTDRYRNASDVVSPGAFDLADLLWSMSSFDGVTITSVRNTVAVSDDQRTYRLAKVRQRKAGRWVNVTKRAAKVRAGKRLALQAVLERSDGSTRRIRYTIKVPKRLRGTDGRVAITGGNQGWDSYYGVKSLGAATKLLRTRVRNDELELDARIGRGKGELRRSMVAGPLRLVVNGTKQVRVVVR